MSRENAFSSTGTPIGGGLHVCNRRGARAVSSAMARRRRASAHPNVRSHTIASHDPLRSLSRRLSRVYGILEDGAVREIRGDPFHYSETSACPPACRSETAVPCQPGKILAVGGNYKSHLGARPRSRIGDLLQTRERAAEPRRSIRIPRDAIDVHYEGELVVIIGAASRRNADEAGAGIFGVTCGNDVSDRNWQHGPGKDLQWWRAKGSDTFAPLGPALVTGLDYGNLQVERG